MSSNTDNIDVTVANEHTGSGEPGEDLLPGHAESENDSTVGHDADSAVGEDNADSTASITSSILRYRTIRGRTFHSERGDAFYWGSNDDAQSEAMDVVHHMWTLAQDGKIFQAPISSSIQRAVDIGCGTGMWAIDFADEFPSCKVVGTDISPIQPDFVPPNLVFEIEDCTQEWTFPPNSFDYPHSQLFKQAYIALKPGGYLESFEASPRIESDDGTVLPDSAMAQWGEIFIRAAEKVGRSFTVIENETQKIAMNAAGFQDIQEWNFKCPLNRWPQDALLKEIGGFAQYSSTQDSEGFLTLMADMAGWGEEEFHVFIARFRREIRDLKNHPYSRMKAVWGRKPFGGEV
ncbi:S-adenosyl-L-methionine-dependent methyltransferase [Fusarium solani]|uniref:S-adenosyl-L-methionine-dependent methyltransferase n=1 Tax=Fusarium solani TaxID=169388 RepID=A0A9P9GL55_FUSSL|nr:S-adenosyl-L-methionine-dependent methyltransferase [Fusarium solani]KAH7240542.1 S-adenosyl-L-methionine-dependent methyltransferase [Fusarium solani]